MVALVFGGRDADYEGSRAVLADLIADGTSES
jgi:hypothetical protein